MSAVAIAAMSSSPCLAALVHPLRSHGTQQLHVHHAYALESNSVVMGAVAATKMAEKWCGEEGCVDYTVGGSRGRPRQPWLARAVRRGPWRTGDAVLRGRWLSGWRIATDRREVAPCG